VLGWPSTKKKSLIVRIYNPRILKRYIPTMDLAKVVDRMSYRIVIIVYLVGADG